MSITLVMNYSFALTPALPSPRYWTRGLSVNSNLWIQNSPLEFGCRSKLEIQGTKTIASVLILPGAASGTTEFSKFSLVTAVSGRAYKTLLFWLRTLHTLPQNQRPKSNSASYPGAGKASTQRSSSQTMKKEKAPILVLIYIT